MSTSVKRPSKAAALRRYFMEMAGVYLNAGCRDVGMADLYREGRENYQQAVKKHNGRLGAIREICSDCVGNDADASHFGLVRKCDIPSCPLHTTRAWQ